MIVPRPSADFEPDVVLLLYGDPNDAVTHALVSGRSQLGWPLVAVSTQQLIDAGGKVHEAVWQLDPIDLRARNRARISPWCRDELLLRRFLAHKAFNAQLQTTLFESLRAIAPSTTNTNSRHVA